MGQSIRDKLTKGILPLMVLLIVIGSFLVFDYRQERANETLRRQLHEQQLQYAPMQRDTIRDSVKLITQQVMVMDRGEYKQLAADRRLLEDLTLKVGQVVADQRMAISTADTVKATKRKSVFAYDDAWLSLRLDTADSILTYKARDSLQTIVARQYKHRFLWWRWGTKGYTVKVVNFNPHSTLLYNSYIQVTQ